MKLSVILTTYNRKKLLKKAIKSVLNQSVKDFELIIVDDCSTDGTDRFVKGIKDPRIRYFKTEKNYGSDSKPKNIGIKNAKGEFIAFLDDDDEYRRDALKVLSKYIEHSKADVVYGDYLIKGKPGWSIDFDVNLLQKMNYIAFPVAMVRRKALLEVGGVDENIPKFKDWNLWLRLQKRGYKFLHIPIIITEVSIQKESISEKFKVDYDEQGKYLPTYFNCADCEIWASKTILGEKKPLKVAIFTLTKDRLYYTKRMVESLLKTTKYPFDWFVVDQGSKDGTWQWLIDRLAELKGINLEMIPIKEMFLMQNKKNVGIAKGWNQAIDLIKRSGDYQIICKIDNDAEFMTQDWLKIMIEIFDRNRTVILSPYVEGLEDTPGGVLRRRAVGSPYVLINERVLGIVPFLGGIVWAAPIEVYDDFKFDEGQFLAGNKDYIISQYARSQGYSLFYCEELRVYHQEGTLGQKKRYPKYFKEREQMLKKKYEKNR